MKISLQNKKALIGGSSKGLGFAVAEQLALSGAQVTIVSSNERLLKERVLALNKKTALKHNFLVCDYNDHESYAKKISEYFDVNTIDILVNNAGIGTLPDFEEEDESGWDEMLSVNAKSIWLGIKSVVSIMKSQQSGSIVNVSSIFGASGGFGKSSSYHASKGAVSALTRNAAIRYANDNIRINSVSPGFIKVLREEKTIEEAGDTMSQEILSRTPMGRWGDADEVAAAIYFLASSESSYITGAELFVDGGWMAT